MKLVDALEKERDVGQFTAILNELKERGYVNANFIWSRPIRLRPNVKADLIKGGLVVTETDTVIKTVTKRLFRKDLVKENNVYIYTVNFPEGRG